MSLHTSLMSSARTVLLTVHGSAGVWYTPLGGAAMQVAAIVGPESSELLEELQMRDNVRARTLQVEADAVPVRTRGGVFQLPIGGGQTEAWTIHRELAVDGGMSRLLVYRIEKIGAGNRRLPGI